MKAITTKLIGYTIIALCILSSCDDHGSVPEPYTRDHVDLWAYMHGTVEHSLTNEKFSVNYVRHPYHWATVRIDKSFVYEWIPLPGKPFYQQDKILFRYASFFFNDQEAINYNEREKTKKMLSGATLISLALNRFVADEVINIVDGSRRVLFDPNDRDLFIPNRNPSVCIEVYDDVSSTWDVWSKQPSVRYVPKDSEPFLVYIYNVEFLDSHDWDSLPRLTLEGHLKGTLYREDNPEDYMVVDMSFGI
jgi:hypothetical protein